MGFLAPLYALAALTLIGPILFHWIRRQPRGEVSFSSLMFLSPSLPRLARRSRLDNLWLLLLRLLALLLIAFAFMRPFLRQDPLHSMTLAGRRVVLLIDISGSMQRGDVWRAAQQIATDVMNDLSPNDQVAVYSIDQRLTALFPLDESVRVAPNVSQRAAMDALLKLEPTWQTTKLAEGLMRLVDLITSQNIADSLPSDSQVKVVLITDLHSGIRLEGLQGYAWPKSIELDIRQVLPSNAGNAHLSLVQLDDDGPVAKLGSTATSSVGAASNDVRVRVENDSNSLAVPLKLSWATADGPLADRATSLQIPPGQAHVVAMGDRPPTVDRILLEGDAWDGDNTLYYVQPTKVTQQIAYCGTTQTLTEEDLSYFLKQAPLSSEIVNREVVAVSPDALLANLESQETCAVVLEPTAAVLEQSAAIASFAERGGVVLICLSRPIAENPGTVPNADSVSEFLRELLQQRELTVREGTTEDFSLLAMIDFAHPLFAPLAASQFNDFSKLRFWSHRRITLPADSMVRVVASFEDKDPLLLEVDRGPGRIWLLTAGWQPTASNLGLSTKFVPILRGLFDPQEGHHREMLSYAVGEPIEVSDPQRVVVTTVNADPVDAEEVERHAQAIELQRPGLYWLQDGVARRQIAVQVPVSESRLVPMDVAQLEQYGITVGSLASDTRRRESLRQMQQNELEKKQRLWQWLIAASLAVLIMETWLAGWHSR